MDRRTQLALNRINARFYLRQAEHFSRTRSRPWPGWQTLLERWWQPEAAAMTASVLDVGCGNGRFAEAVEERLAAAGCEGFYRGLDASPVLLDHAHRRLESSVSGLDWSLGRWDLVAEAWPGAVLAPPAEACAAEPAGGLDRCQYSLVVAFGLLHHVPGFELRRRLLECLGRRVAPGGMLAVSFWCFGELPRFQRRRVPWSELPQKLALGGAGALSSSEPDSLEAGDWLLRWGDGDAVRYCHAASAAEIDALAPASGLPLLDDFRADGAGERLNRYLVWRRSAAA